MLLGFTTPNVKNRTVRRRCTNPSPLCSESQYLFASQKAAIWVQTGDRAQTFVCAIPRQLNLLVTPLSGREAQGNTLAEQPILGPNGSAMRFLTIYKVVLGPVLLAQGRRVRRTALRLAEAAGERSGLVVIESALPELKLLFVGDSTMAGVGVRHQSAALASQVASILANRLVRSVRRQLLAKSGVNTRQALEFVKDRELLPADVLVTALGTNDVTSQKKPYQFIADLPSQIVSRSQYEFPGGP